MTLYCLLSALMLTPSAWSQDPLRFDHEVKSIVRQSDPNQEPLYLFTGSSSVRMWSDLADRFPNNHVINTGFGGSHYSDLLIYVDELILRLNPYKVFIYEGDNDISAGKSADRIMNDVKVLISKIHLHNPSTKIVLISPKPSIARWTLKEHYELLNAELRMLADQEEQIQFADV